MHGEEAYFICFGVAFFLALLAALPVSIIALVLALRANRAARDAAQRLRDVLPRAPERAAEAPPRAAERPVVPWPKPAPPLEAPPAARVPEAAPPEAPTPAAPPPYRPAATGEAAPAPPPAVPRVGGEPPRPGKPAVPRAGGAAPRPAVRWEEWIGLKGLALAGIVVVLIGAALFAVYAAERGWLGRTGHIRVALLALAGLGFMTAGEVFARRAWTVLARVATGGGLAMEYFAAFSAWSRFHIIPEPAAWIFMAAITAAAIVLAVRYASLAVAILSLVGGLAAPLLIRPERDPGHVLFLYMIAVNAGVLVLAYFRKWRVLNLLALAGTVVNVAFWLSAHYWHGGTAAEKLPFIVTYMTILWAAFFALGLIYHLVGRRDPSDLDLPVTLLAAVAYFTGLYLLLRGPEHHWLLGPAAAVLGAVYLGEGLAVRRLAPAQVRFVLLQVAQGLGLLTLAIPIQLNGVFIPMAWAAEASVLVWFGLRTCDWRLRAVGLLVHAASIIALAYYADEAWHTKGALVLNARTATLGAVALAMALSAWLFRRRSDGKVTAEAVAMSAAAALAHAGLMLAIGVEVFRWHADAAAALRKQVLSDLAARLADLRWMRDAFLACGLAAYGVVAAGAAAALRRTFHHGMALVAFAACFAVLLAAQADPAPRELPAVWNSMGATFGVVAACLAAAALVAYFVATVPPTGRGLTITYELLALGVVLGLLLAELHRAEEFLSASVTWSPYGGPAGPGLDFWHSQETLRDVAMIRAAGLAAMGSLVLLRGFWMGSLAHRIAGLAAMALGVLALAGAVLGDWPGYYTVLWQPRGVAFVLLAAAMALGAAGYARRLPQESRERRCVLPVLAILVHVAVLACFTLEAMDFWDARAGKWFPHEELDAWYARHATLSVGYALYALGLLAAGIGRRVVRLRVLALVILAGTLAKVMLLDLSRLEAIWRILSFLGLGLLLLAASLLYYKYRHILFPTEPSGAAGGQATAGLPGQGGGPAAGGKEGADASA
ncbi:MAG: DUF2339 domain-containing protein [Planctomycetes bacterium]|nr:DUF2339 domain-containing protein [Planctomycetota bacterium]